MASRAVGTMDANVRILRLVCVSASQFRRILRRKWLYGRDFQLVLASEVCSSWQGCMSSVPIPGQICPPSCESKRAKRSDVSPGIMEAERGESIMDGEQKTAISKNRLKCAL